jgi:acetylornithine deacetylase/succinyl-diaminopimelate desuccinylase-like protein
MVVGPGDFVLVTEQKGTLTLNFTVTSVTAPVSRPWEAPNPTHLLMADMQSVLALPHKRNSVEEGSSLLLCENDNSTLWHTTCSVAHLTTSQNSPNGINSRNPASASAILEVRFTNEWQPDELLKYIRNAVVHSEIDVVFQTRASVSVPPPTAGAYTRDYLGEAKQLIEAEIGRSVVYGRSHTSSNARYTSSRNIPTIVFGPKYGHTDTGEWVDFPSLVKYHHVIEKLIKHWGAIDVANAA